MDASTAIVFETIGLIKKSLQCSICLDLFNDPYSTRCNHQFCSCCIRKVVDERKDKKQEALCPLCKNPVTKRSLTSNPRLKEIVDVVRKLNDAFQEDAGIPGVMSKQRANRFCSYFDSPYPLVNSKLNGRSYLKFCNPTPVKPVKLKTPESGGLKTNQILNSSVNIQSPNNSLQTTQHPAHGKRISPKDIVSQRRRSTGFEILLDCEDDIQSESLTKCLDEEVKENNETSHEIFREKDHPVQSQAAHSQTNANTASSKSSGSLTTDAGKSSQSSILSDNSLSILDGLLSQQSRCNTQNKCIGITKVKVPGVENKEPKIDKIQPKSSQDGENNNSSKRFNDFYKSPNDELELKRTPENVTSEIRPSPYSVGVNNSSKDRMTIPIVEKIKDMQSPAFVNSNESNTIDRTSDHYSSERVPASVESDSQSYRVIPLPRYNEYPSDDDISPEFKTSRSQSVLLVQTSSEIMNSTAKLNLGEDEMCLTSKNIKFNSSEESELGLAENVSTHLDDNNSEVVLEDRRSFRRKKSKRKHHVRNSNGVSPCSQRLTSQDDSCLPSEKMPESNNEITKQSRVSFSGNSRNSRGNSKNTQASVIRPSQSLILSRSQKCKRKRMVPDNDCLTKCARLNDDNDAATSRITSENEQSLDMCTVRNVATNQSNSTVKKSEDWKVQTNSLLPSTETTKAFDSDEDDIIPPTPPVQIDVSCMSDTRGSTIELLNQLKSESQNITGVRKHAVVDKDRLSSDGEDNGDVDDNYDDDGDVDGDNDNNAEDNDYDNNDDDCDSDDTMSPLRLKKRSKEKIQVNRLLDEDETTSKLKYVIEKKELNDLYHGEEEEELMVVSDEGRSLVLEDDQMYSSQEDLNVVLLRKLGPRPNRYKESETESDGETSDCKNTDTTSISSLTDGDGVEVSSQRIKYLHQVLAHTGGEIEKLTTDLKNLRKGEDNGQQNITRNNHDVFNNDDNMEKNKENNNFENESVSEKEDEADHNYNKKSNDDHLCWENENEDSETSDIENKMRLRKNGVDSDDEENKSDCDVKNSYENKVDKTSSLLHYRKNNYSTFNKYQEGAGLNNEDDFRENTDVEEIDDNQNSDEDDDDEILQRCTLSPPPALDPSTLKLTKLPAAVKNLKKMLQQDVDSEVDQANINHDYSSFEKSKLPKTEIQKVFGKNRHNDDRNQVVLSKRSHEISKTHHDDDKNKHQVKKIETEYKEGSQKENSKHRKRKSGYLQSRMSQDNVRHGPPKNNSSEVLTEKRINTDPTQRTLTSIFVNNMNNETKKIHQSIKTSLCFVITRLPKQFVSLAEYLVKRNGGKMSSDVNEETTHIIMPTDSKMQASRKNYTIKYLLGIALGKWIVSQLWITACVKSGRLVDEKQYEVKGDVEAAQQHVPNLARTTREDQGPLLFDGIFVVCFGKFNGAISQGQLCQLIQYCGGIILDLNHELLNDNVTVSDMIVICDSSLSEETGLQIRDLCEKYSTFPVSSDWVTDSVANYQLQDVEEYRMDI